MTDGTELASAGPATAVAGEMPSPAPPADEAQPELGYQVRLDAFSGPLDLLLYLVRRAEVDVTEIPVALITEQYLAAVGSWEETDLELAGDFILMAAWLLEIKARLVAPPREDEDAGEDDEADAFVDPRADLIEQLLAFRRVKEDVQHLERLEQLQARCRGRRYTERIPEDPELAAGYDLENAEPYQLFLAWDRIQRTIAGQRPRTVFYDDVPGEERRRAIVRVMREVCEADLAWLLAREDTRMKRAGTVLAILECIRARELAAVQHEQYGPVHLRFLPEPERIPAPDAGTTADDPDAAEPPRSLRRRPLVTWRTTEGDTGMADDWEDEVFAETDEQRFVTTLNQEIGIDALLRRVSDLEAGLRGFLAERGLLEEDEEEQDDRTADDGEAAVPHEEALAVVESDAG